MADGAAAGRGAPVVGLAGPGTETGVPPARMEHDPAGLAHGGHAATLGARCGGRAPVPGRPLTAAMLTASHAAERSARAHTANGSPLTCQMSGRDRLRGERRSDAGRGSREPREVRASVAGCLEVAEWTAAGLIAD